jgi:hypothetical protein
MHNLLENLLTHFCTPSNWAVCMPSQINKHKEFLIWNVNGMQLAHGLVGRLGFFE